MTAPDPLSSGPLSSDPLSSDPLSSGPLSSDPLATAPALAFFAVATADGSLDAAEIGRFRTQLEAGNPGGGDAYGPLFTAALGRLSADAETLDAATEAAGEAVLTGGADAAWRAVREALDGEPDGDAARFVADAVAFARGIAEAAGGLYDVGPQISDAEDAAIAHVAAALGAG